MNSLSTILPILNFFSFNKATTFPCIHAVWSRWAPPLERSRMATIAFAGTYVGTIVSMPASGILANKFGWESLFYVFGKMMHTFLALNQNQSDQTHFHFNQSSKMNSLLVQKRCYWLCLVYILDNHCA